MAAFKEADVAFKFLITNDYIRLQIFIFSRLRK